MKVVLPRDIAATLHSALAAAGSREVGGVLMGEHVAEDEFVVREVTVQEEGGTFAYFLRAIKSILAPLERFFRRTGHNYRRFNYLGEWHSHPSFECVPSERDAQTMRELVQDPAVGANFAVLVIVRLDAPALVGSVTAYTKGGNEERGVLDIEGGGQ
ncbi:MAG: Mov34/MPN/PAD-1 family protein [Gemmataceae bacterium]